MAIGERLRVSLVGGPCGVYALVRSGKPVYVGQSLNVFARIATHHNNMRKLLSTKKRVPTVTWPVWRDVAVVFDEVWFWRCAEADLDKEELGLIQRYLPQQNSRLNRPLKAFEAKIAHLPVVLELMKKAEARQGGEIRRRILG